MCAEAGVSGHKTNHSLRATGASELFEAGVPEQMIKERTVHRSLEALRLYERTTEDQHQAVSVILSSSQKTPFKDALIDQEQAVLELAALEQSRTTCFRTAMCMYTKLQ